MEYKVKKHNNATADLKITFNAKEIQEGFTEAYKRKSQNIAIPGFRKGKAPLDIVEKILGDSVTEDAVNILIRDGLKKIALEIDPPAFHFPPFQVDEFNKNKSMVVKVTYETMPVVDLGKYKKRKIEISEVKISEKDLTERLESIRQSMGKRKLRETGQCVEDKDFVEVQISMEPDSLKIGKEHKMEIELFNTPSGFMEHFIGLNIDDEKDFEYTYPEDYNSPELQGKTFHFHIKVLAIYMTEYPELNDEFAKEYDDSYQTLDDLKKFISKTHEDFFVVRLSMQYKNKLIQTIIEDSKFQLPKSMIQEEMDYNFHEMLHYNNLPHVSREKFAELSKKPKEELDKTLEKISEDRIKRSLVLAEIVKEEKLTVSDEELQEKINDIVLSAGKKAKEIEKLYKKEEKRKQLRDEIALEKAMQFIYDSAEKKIGKTISVEDAMKLLGMNKEEE